MSGQRLDPDELALLEEEREHLLTSLEDLEREHDAGDMDDADYETLRTDYTVRAAEVLRAIEERRSLVTQTRAPRSRGRTLATIGVVVALAVLTGVFVARSAGQRGDGAITGAVDTERARLATCQQASMRDPAAGVECYDELLADAPDNVEALTYQGWALIRLDRVEQGAANLGRAVEIDPDYPDARVFRAIVAARGGDHELAAAEIDRFYRNDPSPAAVSVLRSEGLEREVFISTIDEATRGCWQGAAEAQDPEAPDAAAFLTDLRQCLDDVLAQDPDNVDALVSAAYASIDQDEVGDLEPSSLDPAVELAERAVAADPTDPNALLVRASLAFAQARVADAEADLLVLDGLDRPTASFLFGAPDDLRAAIEQAVGSGVQPDTADSATTTTAPGTTAPGAPSVPNREGG